MTYVMASPLPTIEQALAQQRAELVARIERHAEAYMDHDEPDFYLGLLAAIRIIEHEPGDTP